MTSGLRSGGIAPSLWTHVDSKLERRGEGKRRRGVSCENLVLEVQGDGS